MGLQKDVGLVSKLGLEWVGNQHMDMPRKAEGWGCQWEGSPREQECEVCPLKGWENQGIGSQQCIFLLADGWS